MPGGAIDRVCRKLYALALILGVLVAVLTPLHARSTRSWWVVGATPDAVILDVSDPGNLGPGDRLPLFRFHNGFKRPIGEAVVVGPVEGGLEARVVPGAMRYPVGRQGRVVTDHGEVVQLELTGATPGLRLYAFSEGHRVADLVVDHAVGDLVRAKVKRLAGAPRDLGGLAVTEFTVPTRAVPFDAPWLWLLEALLLGVTLGGWCLSWVHPGPGRAWMALAGGLRSAAGRIAERESLRLAFHAVVGFPFVWIGGQLLWFGGTWILNRAVRWLWAWDLVAANPFPPFPDLGLPLVWGAGAVAYAGWLVVRRTSPVLAFWDLLGWQPVLPWVPGRGYVLWALHLLIAYMFASTLGGFLQGNLRAAGNIVANDITPEAAFELARYSLWSFTILGCLFGYGHTVLSVLWTRPIRELDFSIAGWATTAACYGPLLGAVVEHVSGGISVGDHPVVTAGPLYPAILAGELLLNALYTASIWNLGRYFGVMTDKGVRTTGFYATVRHPSYTLEALMFVVMALPWTTGPAQWAVGLAFVLKYWLRSEREDHFMSAANPDYAGYREQVPWKFVPGLY